MESIKDRRIRCVYIVFSLLLFPIHNWAFASHIDILALDDDAVPGGLGLYSFDQQEQTVSVQGDFVTFSANTDAPVDQNDVLLISEKSASIVVIAKDGDAVPGTNIITNLARLGGPVINAVGEVAAPAKSHVAGNVNDTRSELFVGSALGVGGAIASEGESEPGGDGSLGISFPAAENLIPAIDVGGVVAFSAFLTGTTGGASDDAAIYRWDGQSFPLVEIVREGQVLPGGTATYTDSFPSPQLGSNGDVTFLANIQGGPAPETNGVFIGDGTTVTTIARYNTPFPGGNAFSHVLDITSVDTNDHSEVAILAVLIGLDRGVYIADGLAINEIAVEGGAAPGGSEYRTFSREVKVDNYGRVAFEARLLDSAFTDRLFFGDQSSVTEIAAEGEAAPSGGNFSSFDKWSVSPFGRIAFQSKTTLGTDGIYTLDVLGNVASVAVTGDALAGDNITKIWLSGKDAGQSDAVNDEGDIAFSFELSDGRRGIAIWRSEDGIPEENAPFPLPFTLLLLGILVGIVSCQLERESVCPDN